MTASDAARLSPAAPVPYRQSRVQRIVRISRVVSDLRRAETFYRHALGFRAIARGRLDAATIAALGSGEAEEIVMRLGAEEIALVHFAVPGHPYPPDRSSDDLWFQHLAIVVSGMDAAYAHLCSQDGWRPISEGGPQLLPPSNGSVQAFKFRDPDGHPLELIRFPPGQGRPIWHKGAPGGPFLGIDHSALAVAATPRSLDFYRGLGLQVSDRSVNHGPAQARLDGLPGAVVRVTGLRPASAAGPGLELLGYDPPGRPAGIVAAKDGVTDWLTLAVSPSPGASPCPLHDPDGHRLVLVAQCSGTTGLPA